MWSLAAVGRIEEAEELAAEEQQVADRIGHFVAQLLAERLVGVLAYRPTGDLDLYEAFAKNDFRRCTEADVAWITNAHGFLAVNDLWRGRLEAALERAKTCLDTEPPGGFQGWGWPLVFLVLVMLDRREEAMRMFNDVRDRIPRSGQPAPWGSWCILHGAVEGLSLLGERELAAELYPLVLETERTGAQFVRVYDVRLTGTVAGIGAHAARRWEESESHFAAALKTADDLPIRIEQAEVRFFFARMLAERDRNGDRDRARKLAEEAIDIYGGVGMPWHLERAQTLLKSL
jgi:tetratricopeptide (TPR) repeat protein